jgi:predicted outer membrane repeat protein
MGNVINCDFTNNTAYKGYAGAVYFSRDTMGNVLNCNFTDNSATYGGAIAFEGSGAVENCNFVNNSAAYGGGAIYGDGDSATKCQFINNSAKNGGATYLINADYCNFTNNYATDYGGAMYGGVNNTCIFKGNKAGISGDDIYNTKAVNLAANYTVSVLNDGFAVNIVVNADCDINGNITIKFNGKQYPVEMIKGTASFLSDKVYSNTYPTDIVYAGSQIYNSSACDINVVVKATKVSRVNTFTYYYYNNDMGSDSEKGISQIRVVDIDGNPIKGGLVTLTIMNKYKLKVRTDANGIAKFTKAYKPGTYKVTATYDNKVTNLGNLVLKSVLNVPKVTTVKKSAKTTTLKITLKGTGPIKGKTVQVSFMKKNYYVKTDSKGVAQFKVTQDMVSKLAVGKTYKIRVTYRMDSVAQSIKIVN